MKDQHALTSRDTFNRYNTLYQGPFTQRARTIKTSPAEYFDDGQIDEAVNLVNHDQTDIRGPQNDLYDRFYRRNSSNRMTLLGKEYISRKSKINDADPKILVSHFHNEYDPVNMDNFSRQISITRVSPYSEKEASVGKQFSEFMKRKTQKNFTVIGKQRGTKLLEDPLKRKSPYTARVGATRNASGRLLGIMAKQALVGRNLEISKAFQVALLKTNADALRKARKELFISKRKRLIKFFRKIKIYFHRMSEIWMPDSLAVVLWKCLVLVNIIAQICFSTYIVCFLPSWERNFRNAFFLVDFFGDLIYLFEILTQFQIAFYSQGELRVQRSQIVGNYLGTTFLWDMISMLSLIGRFFPESPWMNLMLLTNLRIYKLWPSMSTIEDFFQFSKEMSAILSVVKLIVVICLFAHYCACIMFCLTKVENADLSWIHKIGYDLEHDELYLVSLYSSVYLMSTGGFGDIVHQTQIERAVIVAIMIVNSIVFGYILSVIGNLLIEVSAYSTEAKHKIRVLTKYMNDKGLNKTVQSKIRKYLEFFLAQENADKIEGDDIVKMLAPNLQEEIVREVNAKILNDSYVFSANYRKRFLYLVSKDLIERSFGPEETLFYRHEDGDLSIYFITSGKIDLCYERCGTSLQKVGKGEACGLYSFFSGKRRTLTAKSIEFTTVFQLPRTKFLEKLELFATEKETYYMMKDSMNLYKNSKYLNIECYSCGSVEHEISYCPNIHITIDRAKVIEKYLEDEAEFKRKFVRRQRQRFNTFKSIEQLNEAATQFQMGHQTEIQYSIDSSDPEEEEMGAVSSYSSLDEVLDRKIYDPHPLDYVEDTDNVKILDMSRNYVHISKKNRQKVGQIETFMKNNYDPYYHNLNLDRVKNFEVYYPNNNIAKLMIEFEKRRLEKIVEMRLGIRAKHLCTFLAQGVRNTERKNTQAQSLVPIQKRISLKKQISLRKQMSLRRKEKKPPASPRRDSASSNPGDIVLYSSKSAKNLKPSQYKINQPMVPQTLSNGSYLDPNSSTKQRDYENSLNKIGRSKDLELSTIKEHSYDRLEIADGVRGRLSVDYSPMSLMPTESKASMIAASRKKINGSIDALLLGTLIKTPENGSSPSHHLLQDNIKETYSKDSEPLGETGREIERSQDAATIDYSKLINKIHDKDLNTKLTMRSEKEVSSVEEKSLLQYLRINEGSAKAFQQALQGRKKEEKKKRKLRASSESQRNKNDDEEDESCEVLETEIKIGSLHKKTFNF